MQAAIILMLASTFIPFSEITIEMHEYERFEGNFYIVHWHYPGKTDERFFQINDCEDACRQISESHSDYQFLANFFSKILPDISSFNCQIDEKGTTRADLLGLTSFRFKEFGGFAEDYSRCLSIDKAIDRIWNHASPSAYKREN